MSQIHRRFIRDYANGDEIRVRLGHMRRVEHMFDSVEHALSVKEPGSCVFANAAIQRMRRESDKALKHFIPIAQRGFENQMSGALLACSILRLQCALAFPSDSVRSALSGEKFKIGQLNAGYTDDFARKAYEETARLAKSLSGSDIEAAKALAEVSKARLHREAAKAAAVALRPALVKVPSKEEIRAMKARAKEKAQKPIAIARKVFDVLADEVMQSAR